MHLGDRRGGKRRLIELGEHLGHRPAVGALDVLAGYRAGEWGHPVLEFRQLIRDIFRQQVAARGHGLSKLHEDRAELLQGQPQALAATGVTAALEPDAGREKKQEAQRPVEVSGADEVVEAMFEKYALDLQEPREHAQLHVRATRFTVRRRVSG